MEEMKANELMIGDKVMVKVLSQIPDTYVLHTWTANDYSRDIQVKPIKLTPEILEKNGFKYKTTDWNVVYEGPHYGKYNLKKFHVLIGKENITLASYYFYIGHGDVDAHGFAQINYVHELQHALRLCGLNELADNFKV